MTFRLLTRYYVISKISGAHHLFCVKAKSDDLMRASFFRGVRKPLFKNHFHANYLMWYLDFMYEQIGLAPTGMKTPKAFDVLLVAQRYWYQCVGAQDTMVVCLEVQQMWMYFFLRHKLMRWLKKLKKENDKEWPLEARKQFD